MPDPQSTISVEEISKNVADFIQILARHGDTYDAKNRIIFLAAVNAVMVFIAAVKLQTGCTTAECRKHVIDFIDEKISKIDEEGDQILTWHDGEARA